jgi:hypothetical protein
MAAYSVIGRDDEPAEDSDATSGEPSVLSYARAASLFERPASGEAPRAERLPESALAEVVLQLPDLSTLDEPLGAWWVGLSNRLFWVGIILGGLLALALIWNPKKPPPDQLDAAPAWSGQAASPPAPSAAHVGALPIASTPAPSPWPLERTARGGSDTVWDGRAPHVQPGEAAPTGRIINTLVHE